MEPVHILIAEDQVITRSGLRTLLASVPGLEVVGEATNGAEVIEMATALQPEIILMDLIMPEVNGIEATHRIHRTNPRIAILVLTQHDDDTFVFPVIRAGASGYLLKDADRDELVGAIHIVANYGAVFSPGIAQRALQFFQRSAAEIPDQAFDKLTAREYEILTLMAEGYKDREIAERLVISLKTVPNHVGNILHKLQVNDRAIAMHRAWEAGLGRSKTG